MNLRKTLAPGARSSWEFFPGFPLAQCVAIFVGAERDAALSVASVTVAGVEQLLGEGVPASFFASGGLQLDRQSASAPLVVTLQNDGDAPAQAEVQVEFVPVEALDLQKGRLH